MVERRKLKSRGGSYFAAPKEDIEFISSGSKLLDLALGGGWARRRVANIIGDKSTGKTLLCIEACANFAIQVPKGKIRYREAEAAFDQGYAQAIGMPLDRIDFGKDRMETVEDLFEELEHRAEHATQPELFIVDSLDALSSRAERKRGIDEDSYGGDKAKKMSELFRRVNAAMSDRDITMLIVSQVRDNIGARFGRKWRRTGGRALDFYASQAVYLAQTGTVSREAAGERRAVGIDIKAKLDKNKIGLNYREAEFPILFGYGIDDIGSCVTWLKKSGGKKLDQVLKGMKEPLFKTMVREHQGDWRIAQARMHRVVEDRWYEIEESFLPKQRKYG